MSKKVPAKSTHQLSKKAPHGAFSISALPRKTASMSSFDSFLEGVRKSLKGIRREFNVDKNCGFLMVFGTVSGCRTTRQIVGPDGTPHQLVNCYAIEGCYAKAREVCAGNYKIINTSSEATGDVTTTSFNLLVKCEK